MSTSARRLLLYGDLAELKRLAIWLEGWATQDLSANISFAVQVCLEEAIANIIMYGTSTDDQLEIVVEVEHGDQTLIARLGVHSIRPRFRGLPFRLRSQRQRSAILASI